jgi:hypothetical protein
MQTLDFLKLVLPDKGQYCWVTIKNKKAKQGFVPTIEALAQKLLEEDAKGTDVYFACASYLQPTKRTHENACAVKAFWLDIDAGPGKPYADADIAIDALDEFCNKAGLPFATVVRSGNGVHAWWPLDYTIEPKEWRNYAGRLKSLCATHNFSADPSRTSDISSILRAPGTRNFKDPAVPRPVSVEAFEEEEQESGAILTSLSCRTELDIVKDWDTLKPKEEELDFAKGYGDGQRTEALVKRAGFLFGPASNFTLEAGVESLLKWNLFNTPPLAEEKVRSTANSIFKSELAKRERDGRFHSVHLQLPKLPHGYRWNTAGQLTAEVLIDEGEDDEHFEWVHVTKYPLYLLAVTRKEYEREQAYFFRVHLPHEEPVDFKISCSDFESRSWKSIFNRSTGHVVLNDKLFIGYVHSMDSMIRDTGMDSIRYQQFGWKDDETKFLVGDTLIHQGGKVETVYGGEEIAHRMRQMAPRKGGNLSAWTADANLLFSEDYIHLGYTLVSSFATVLFKLCMGESDGGFVLSITSPGSGKGKTRIIEAATSVWGELVSCQITPRDTLNAQMALLTAGCHIPSFMDEWYEKDPAIMARFIRQLTVGHDKNRAQRDGSVKAKPAEYKTLLITTSNHSIYEIMHMINDEATMARVVEIVAPDIDGEQFKRLEKLTSRMLKNSGYAGREFIYQLMQPGVLDEVRADLDKAIQGIREALKTSPQHRYITVLPACILVAAKILLRSGILEFDERRLMNWAFQHVKHRMENTDKVPASEILNQFLRENVNKILMVNRPAGGNVPVQILGSYSGNVPNQIIARSERDTKRVYLAVHEFKSWCMKNNHDLVVLATELEREGILIDRKRKTTLGAGTTASNLGRTVTWELLMDFTEVSGE